jgi:SAM-dependent methyltransferase
VPLRSLDWRNAVGLGKQCIALILQEHKKDPRYGPVLTLGRQEICCDYESMVAIFNQLNIPLLPLPEGIDPRATLTDKVLFGHLGLEVNALDYSAFEGAEIIHDLNQPIPDHLKGKYATIIDGGTLEHVFDVRQSLENVAELLAPDGKIIHQLPVNNYVNHGFYQFSPTILFDFYEANRFADLSAFLIIQPREHLDQRPWCLFPYDPHLHSSMCNFSSDTENMLAIHFVAVKTDDATSNTIPTQRFYRHKYEGRPLIHVSHDFVSTDDGFQVARRMPRG